MGHAEGNEEVHVPAMTAGMQLWRIPVGEGLIVVEGPESPGELAYVGHHFAAITLVRREGEDPHVAKSVDDEVAT